MESVTERRLAAILATDVVGYSRLVETDEAGTLRDLKALRRDILEPLIAQSRGRIVKLMGDGIIVEFSSIVAAVTCAEAIQSSVTKIQQTIASDRQIVLRIGVHLGDVIVEGEDLLGDGVNIAARLEQHCLPGGVLISGAAYEQLPGKLDFQFLDSGELTLKNIARPVRAFRLAPGAEVQSAQSHTNPATDKPVVAVLPFQNLSDDPGQIYFSDGITEDIITELSRFRELLVIAQNSSFSFRGKSVDVRAIGRALGASHVLEGNVRLAGEHVRINVQLVDASTGIHLWADRYDRALADVFAVQEEIAQSIVARVAERVIDEREIAARRRRPQDLRAYDLFLRALRYGGTSFTPEVLRKLEALYRQIISIDPTFARAYSGLAFIHRDRSIQVIAGVRSQPDEEMLLAMDLAEKALALDPNDARVQSAFAWIRAYARDFDRAEQHFDLARSMNPNDAAIQILYASLLCMRGKPERGLTAAEIAFRLNPRHPPWYSAARARLLFQLGDYGRAATLLEKPLWDDHARHLRDLGWRTAAFAHAGRLDDAARSGDELARQIASNWKGDPGASASVHMDWVIWFSFLEQSADRERLRAGLRLAGLPA